jgi:hypothetical protein
VLIDGVALRSQEGGLHAGVGSVKATIRGQDAPPRQVDRLAKHVGDCLCSAGSTDLPGDVAVRHEFAWREFPHRGDDRSLERRGFVTIRPWPGPRWFHLERESHR